MIPPKEGPEGVPEGALLKIIKSVYGLIDAPRAWFRKFRETLRACGWIESRLEKALFYLREPDGSLCGIRGPHVDDVIITGRGPRFERSLSKLESCLNWGKWVVDEFVHCGRQIRRDAQGDVLLDQHTYVGNLKEIELVSTRNAVEPTSQEMDAAQAALHGQLAREHEHRVDGRQQ